MSTTIATTGAALNLYRALLTAAEQAPEEREEWNSCLTFRHNRTMLKLAHTAKRLRQFATDMLKAWHLWGGGEKPASDKPKKAPRQWKDGTVRVVAALLEDGDYSAALELAERECGGIVCQSETGEPFLFYAREQIEGMPEGVEVGKTCAGNWVVAHGKTGRVIYKVKTKASALAMFAIDREPWSAEDFAEVLARLTDCDFESARATWMMQNGIAPAPESLPPVADAAPVEALPVPEVAPVAQAVEPAIEAQDVLNMTVPEAQAMPATEYTITIKPLRAGGKPSAIVRCPSPDGYKTRAARLAGSIARERYSRRHGGYIMSVAASVRFEALYSAGAEACAVTGDIYHTVAAPAPVAIAAPASPEYVALRSAARAARRVAVAAINAARVSSAQAAPAPARAQADDGNPYPYLIPTEGQRGGVAAAKNIRLVLKNEFPGIKFRVTSDYSSVHVKWTDGPTSAQVDQALAPFDIGHSDSQSDYFYTTSTRFSDTFGGVQYLFTNRALSDAAIGASLSAVFGPNGPSVEDYHNARAWHQVQHGTFTGAQMWGDYEWMAMVRRHADGSE